MKIGSQFCTAVACAMATPQHLLYVFAAAPRGPLPGLGTPEPAGDYHLDAVPLSLPGAVDDVAGPTHFQIVRKFMEWVRHSRLLNLDDLFPVIFQPTFSASDLLSRSLAREGPISLGKLGGFVNHFWVNSVIVFFRNRVGVLVAVKKHIRVRVRVWAEVLTLTLFLTITQTNDPNPKKWVSFLYWVISCGEPEPAGENGFGPLLSGAGGVGLPPPHLLNMHKCMLISFPGAVLDPLPSGYPRFQTGADV